MSLDYSGFPLFILLTVSNNATEWITSLNLSRQTAIVQKRFLLNKQIFVSHAGACALEVNVSQ